MNDHVDDREKKFPAVNVDDRELDSLAREIICLQGRQLSKEAMCEISKRTSGMAALYGCTRRVLPQADGHVPVHTVRFMPMTLFPSTLPCDVIDEAMKLQVHFNTLLLRVAHDHDFLYQCLQHVIRADPFTGKMWQMYEQSRGDKSNPKIGLAIFRNDFLLVPQDDVMNTRSKITGVQDVDPTKASRQYCPGDKLQLKQVEINGIAVGIAGMHDNTRDCYKYAMKLAGLPVQENQLPVNDVCGIAKGLIKAWELYGNNRAAILFVVQTEPYYLSPEQRWVERRIFENNSAIPVLYRSYARLVSDLDIKDGTLLVSGQEISVVYLREGFDASQFKNEQEYDARLRLELSRAIKVPPIQLLLAQSKKVQQVLSEEGQLERFVEDPEVAAQIRRTFVPQYSFESGANGERMMQMARENPARFVLKTQQEGGGVKYFTEASILQRLDEIEDKDKKDSYVLMERILPVYQYNTILTPDYDVTLQPVINELGVYGVIIGSADEVLVNEVPGISMKTKNANDDEGGLSGSGVIDFPFLLKI